MNKLAILVVNGYYNDSRVVKQSRTLSQLFSVDVICLHDERIPSASVPHGINIYKVARYRRFDHLLLRKVSQLLTYIIYLFSVFIRLRKYDFVHCNDLETLPIAITAKLFYRKLKVYYDAHEYETETLWMTNPIKKYFAKKVEHFCVHKCEAVSVVSNSIASEYQRLYGIEKPHVIMNTPYYQVGIVSNAFREKFVISDNKTIFLYQGGLTSGRGIEILLKVFCSLPEDFVLVLMGYGSLERLVSSYDEKYSNIFFHPAVPQSDLLSYTSSADFGISFIEDKCLNYRYCLPNKLFEYLMAGLPVITSNLPEMRSFIDEYNVGYYPSNNTEKDIRDCIIESRATNVEELKENIKKTRLAYNWEKQEKLLLSMYGNN